MVIFTYYDYLKYKNLYFYYNRTQMKLADNNQEYTYRVNKEHDKIFKTIFEDKEEVAKFINKSLKLKNKVTKEQLERYNSSYCI